MSICLQLYNSKLASFHMTFDFDFSFRWGQRSYVYLLRGRRESLGTRLIVYVYVHYCDVPHYILNVHVHMYMYMCVLYMYTCTHVHVHVCIVHVHMYTCTCTCVYCTCTCMYCTCVYDFLLGATVQ